MSTKRTVTAQYQAQRINSMKHRVDKQDISDACVMCKEREETGRVRNVSWEILQKLWRHDKAPQLIHCLRDKFGFDIEDKQVA